MTEERIITRIQKMLALANDLAATEGERDNALRMAYKLIAKHNLDMEKVKNHGKAEPRVDNANTCFGMPWARTVSMSIAELFFCYYYYGNKVNGTQIIHHFVGKESNALTAAVMADWIVKSILKECRARYGHNLAPKSRAFATGAAYQLWKRVDELRKQEEAIEPGTGLVLASLYRTEADANNQFLTEAGVKIVTKKSTTKGVNFDAYHAGKEYGDTINLSRQLNADADTAGYLE